MGQGKAWRLCAGTRMPHWPRCGQPAAHQTREAGGGFVPLLRCVCPYLHERERASVLFRLGLLHHSHEHRGGRNNLSGLLRCRGVRHRSGVHLEVRYVNDLPSACCPGVARRYWPAGLSAHGWYLGEEDCACRGHCGLRGSYCIRLPQPLHFLSKSADPLKSRRAVASRFQRRAVPRRLCLGWRPGREGFWNRQERCGLGSG
mmetsp:Transcript_49904/g.132615  ORF Transcript_49904/g.132615 Transcript_49904/m.132615 type:complete len:202 (-) Transcript_49904:1591-2196(-)